MSHILKDKLADKSCRFTIPQRNVRPWSLHPFRSRRLIHLFITVTHFHPHPHRTHTAPPPMHGDTRSLKTSEVGANRDSRLTPSITNSPLAARSQGDCGTHCLLHTFLDKRVFCNLQCQMCSLKSCLRLPPEKWSRLKLHREVSRRGRMNIVYAFHVCSSSLIVQVAALFLILTLMFLFLSWASLPGAILYLMCVFFKKDDYICVLLVPLSGSVGWTCLSAAIF